MDCVDSYEHAGMTVEITYDSMPQDSDPREGCNVGVMLCGHRRYNLGDEQIPGDGFCTSLTCPSCGGTGENPARSKLSRLRACGWVIVGAGSIEAMEIERSRIIARAAAADRAREAHTLMIEICDCPRCESRGEIDVSVAAYLTQERGATVSLPLGLIDHSGISMYVGSGAHRHDPGGWDSGQVGVIFDTPATRKAFGMEDATPQEIECALRTEVNTYDAYLRGEVYCYTVTDPDGEHLDSSCGYLGDLDYVRRCANEAAEYAAEKAKREQHEKHLMACRGIATT